MSCHKRPSYLCQKQQYRRLNQSAVHSPIPSSHPIILKSFPKNSPLNFLLQRRSTPSKTHKSCAALDSRHHLNFASFIHITLNIHTTNQNKTITSPRNKQDESTRLLSVTTTTTTNIYYFYNYFSNHLPTDRDHRLSNPPKNSTSDHREPSETRRFFSVRHTAASTHPPRFVTARQLL